ncbi:MAG: HslU--HslV peptidase ATPase subunit, partial [Candidatus Hydrogenedentes bacterium]|nr:HslU--HslV peptidase ATPase subunit [Candidatus Hydrogenedentota bacterium]
PIRVELDSLHADDFVRILTEPKCSLVKQYQALLATEGVTLEFTGDAVVKLAEICERVNTESEDIGARRLHTILEYLLEEMAFSATEKAGETIVINVDFVENQLEDTVEKQDLSRYVL